MYFRLFRSVLLCLQVIYPGHKASTETISVLYGPDTFSAVTQNFLLQKLDYSALITQLPMSTNTSVKLNPGNNSASLLANTVTALTALIIQRLLRSWDGTKNLTTSSLLLFLHNQTFLLTVIFYTISWDHLSSCRERISYLMPSSILKWESF